MMSAHKSVQCVVGQLAWGLTMIVFMQDGTWCCESTGGCGVASAPPPLSKQRGVLFVTKRS